VALSVIVKVPLRDPIAVGTKTIPRVQEFPGWIADWHPFVCTEKSPVIPTLATSTWALPVLVMVTFCGLLVVPTN
jgi:hypothetical protein